MILARVYKAREEIPKGAEQLYQKTGALFIRVGAKRDLVTDNPWDADNWNLTAQGKFIQDHGMVLARAFAKIAGTTVGGLKPTFQPPRDLQVIVQRRDISTLSVGSVGGGSSGDGPPDE